MCSFFGSFVPNLFRNDTIQRFFLEPIWNPTRYPFFCRNPTRYSVFCHCVNLALIRQERVSDETGLHPGHFFQLTRHTILQKRSLSHFYFNQFSDNFMHDCKRKDLRGSRPAKADVAVIVIAYVASADATTADAVVTRAAYIVANAVIVAAPP